MVVDSGSSNISMGSSHFRMQKKNIGSGEAYIPAITLFNIVRMGIFKIVLLFQVKHQKETELNLVQLAVIIRIQGEERRVDGEGVHWYT